MTVRVAVVKKGQLLLEEPLPFPDGTRLKLTIEPAADDLLQFIIDHAVDTGIPDLAEEHDHYTYGTPKRRK